MNSLSRNANKQVDPSNQYLFSCTNSKSPSSNQNKLLRFKELIKIQYKRHCHHLIKQFLLRNGERTTTLNHRLLFWLSFIFYIKMKKVSVTLLNKKRFYELNKKHRRRKRISMDFSAIQKYLILGLKIDVFVYLKNLKELKRTFRSLKKTESIKTKALVFTYSKKEDKRKGKSEKSKTRKIDSFKKNLAQLLININNNRSMSETVNMRNRKKDKIDNDRDYAEKLKQQKQLKIKKKKLKAIVDNYRSDLFVINEEDVETDSFDSLRDLDPINLEKQISKSQIGTQNELFEKPIIKNLISIDNSSKEEENGSKDNFIDFSFVSEANISDFSFEQSIEDDIISNRHSFKQYSESPRKRINFKCLKTRFSSIETPILRLDLSPEPIKRYNIDSMVNKRAYGSLNVKKKSVIERIIELKEVSKSYQNHLNSKAKGYKRKRGLDKNILKGFLLGIERKLMGNHFLSKNESFFILKRFVYF